MVKQMNFSVGLQFSFLVADPSPSLSQMFAAKNGFP